MDRRSFLGGAGLLALLGTAGCLCGYSASAAAGPGAGTTTGSPAGTSGGPTDGEGTTTGSRSPTATPGDTTGTPDGTPTDGPTTTPTPTPTPTPPPSSVTVEVGKDGAFYAPEQFELAVGGTVEWVWVGNQHNIVVDAQPSGADWQGTPGSRQRVYDEGYTYSHTFDVAGDYEYHCYNHDQYGMVGSFTVR